MPTLSTWLCSAGSAAKVRIVQHNWRWIRACARFGELRSKLLAILRTGTNFVILDNTKYQTTCFKIFVLCPQCHMLQSTTVNCEREKQCIVSSQPHNGHWLRWSGEIWGWSLSTIKALHDQVCLSCKFALALKCTSRICSVELPLGEHPCAIFVHVDRRDSNLVFVVQSHWDVFFWIFGLMGLSSEMTMSTLSSIEGDLQHTWLWQSRLVAVWCCP